MKKTARVFKALGDETRLRIMGLLLEGGELCVCDLMEVLDLPQSTVSRHLAYLRNAGLVDDRRQGAWVYYRLIENDGMAGSIVSALRENFDDIEQAGADQKRLSSYLATKKADACS